MTCQCPRGWCYQRPDCRNHVRRRNMRIRTNSARHKLREAEALNALLPSIVSVQLDWLTARRDALHERLALELSGHQRRAARAALELINNAIRRQQEKQNVVSE